MVRICRDDVLHIFKLIIDIIINMYIKMVIRENLYRVYIRDNKFAGRIGARITSKMLFYLMLYYC